MRYPRWTEEQLRSLYETHGNWEDVARALGANKHVLLRRRKALGMDLWVRPDPKRRAWRKSRLEPLKDRIVQMAQTMNCGEIARELNEDPEVVRDFLSKIGVQRQKAGARRGEKNPMWKGGRVIDPDGYILVKAPDGHSANHLGYVREHRLVMERKIGRLLLPEEVVHHIDGNPQNNHPDNLVLFPGNGEHLREEWKNEEWREHQRAIRAGVPSKRGSRQSSENDAQAS